VLGGRGGGCFRQNRDGVLPGLVLEVGIVCRGVGATPAIGGWQLPAPVGAEPRAHTGENQTVPSPTLPPPLPERRFPPSCRYAQVLFNRCELFGAGGVFTVDSAEQSHLHEGMTNGRRVFGAWAGRGP